MERRGPLIRLVLAAALLAGWQLALIHPLQHVGAKGALVHLDGGDSERPEPLCELIAALGACAPGLPLHLPACCAVEVRAFRDSTPQLRPAAPPFLSHGPPHFSEAA